MLVGIALYISSDLGYKSPLYVKVNPHGN
jgi:hypothetical protein